MLGTALAAFAQGVPQGMNYQAAARDAQGAVLPNQKITIKISLLMGGPSGKTLYREVHDVTTNQLGLFDLTIGQGLPEKGAFADIPWSTGEMWIDIALDESGKGQFTSLGASKLLTVPYAMHAGTASRSLVNEGAEGGGGKKWDAEGNTVNDVLDVLGSVNSADLVVVTNNVERMRVEENGNVSMNHDLDVTGSVTAGSYNNLPDDSPTNELNTSLDLSGNTLSITDAGGSVSTNLSSFMDSKWQNSGAHIYRNLGNVGIGINTPNAKLHVQGNANFGISNTVNSTEAFVGGASSDVTGFTSFAFGRNDTITSESSAAFGFDNNAAGYASFTAGRGNIASGNHATAFGFKSKATGSSSFTVNALNTASGDNTAAFGTDMIASSYSEFSIGMNGTAYTPNSTTGYDGSDRIFNIGNGTNTSERSDALTVLKNGRVGIGTSAPEHKLSLIAADTGYIASFVNTNSGNGDGIKIKLGKTHPRWDDSASPPFSNEVTAQVPGFGFLNEAVTQSRDLVLGMMTSPATTFTAANFDSIGYALVDALETEIGGSFEDLAALACNTTNDVIDDINSGLGLPFSTPTITVPEIKINKGLVFGGLELPLLPDVPELPENDEVLFGGITLPILTLDTIVHLVCPARPTMSGFSLPNFKLTNVNNTLTNENQYLQFTDKDDRQLGAVRAESIEQWTGRYLGLTYFLNVFNSFAGVTVIGLDPTQLAETFVKYAINGLTQVSSIADAYNSIGVEYSSGFGDYAEWLERADHLENIKPGDIVGVSAGKISKDLANAEQVMAVSSKPIVLGNSPAADQEVNGNKVAFMGQIPVKIMGTVRTGDFIVGNGAIPGYGVAIHPEDMTVEDFAMAVGRSWETVETPGPKMVNTVVGVHNGNSLDILKKYQQQLSQAQKHLEQNDARLNALEARLDMNSSQTQLNK